MFITLELTDGANGVVSIGFGSLFPWIIRPLIQTCIEAVSQEHMQLCMCLIT